MLRHGGGGAPTTLVCGAVRFEHPAARRLVEVLPDVIRVAASDPLQAEWTQATLRLMAAEARELRPGGEAAMTRLADVLVIQALRAWLDADPAARTGWLGALRDPDLGGAIAAVHRDPARTWSVAALAHGAAMSRSAFAARFAELVGEPPMQYVTRVRMQLAHDALRTERHHRGRARGPLRLPLRGRVRARLQAHDGRPAGRRQALTLTST